MSQELIALAEFYNSREAVVAKESLESSGISVQLLNEQGGEHNGELALTIQGVGGLVQLYVLETDTERALELLRNLSLDCKFLIERA